AFAAMLAIVLAGLVAGGALSTRLFRDEKPISAATVAVLFAAASAALAWQHGAWPGLSERFAVQGGMSFARAEATRMCVAASLLLPAATVLGMVYPALFRLRELGPGQRAATVARMGAVNSVGCVLGALVTGFALIPRLGSEASSRALGLALAASGLV